VLAIGRSGRGQSRRSRQDGWDTFKAGYASTNSTGSRLTSGLGSNRYDFYRVGLNEFAAHPLLGIGADNFQQTYLAHGRSEETPHYPHSVELRTLVETGLVGRCWLWWAWEPHCSRVPGASGRLRSGSAPIPWRETWRRRRLRGSPTGSSHGSFDWFWEFAGGRPAFALLGLACGLAPRPERIPDPPLGTGGSEARTPPSDPPRATVSRRFAGAALPASPRSAFS